jgi:PAS domain-containing protein
MSSNDLTHPDDLEENRKLYRRVQEGASEEEVVTKRYIRKDGRAVWVRVRVRVVNDVAHRTHHDLSSRRAEGSAILRAVVRGLFIQVVEEPASAPLRYRYPASLGV